ncbi:MAG: hypothetical protein ACRD3W_03205 [Terriglobales bacterium]
MKHKYITAWAIGLLIGLAVILGIAVLIPVFGDSWTIPSWDSWIAGMGAQAAPLQTQAVLLRACRLLLESGFWFLALPVAVACGVVRLNEVSNKSDLLWSLEAFIRTVLVLSSIAYGFGFLVVSFYKIGEPIDAFAKLLWCHAAGFVTVLILWVFPAIPVYGLIVFSAIWAGLTFNRFRKTARKE